jgi:dihydropyrimidine dehydrogenase (NAD+) subunit PreA
MLHGFRIVEEMKDGLSRWMDEKGYNASAIFQRRGGQHHRLEIPRHELQVIAQINQDDCIKCGRCYVACEDTSHQSINQLIDAAGTRTYEVIKDECVGVICARSPVRCRVASRWCRKPRQAGMNWTQDPANWTRAETA